jgi:hypothetical protein
MTCPKCFPGNYWEPPSICGDCERALEDAERAESDRRLREQFEDGPPDDLGPNGSS